MSFPGSWYGNGGLSGSAGIEALGIDTLEPTGFVDRSDSTIAFTNGTRTFSIQPIGTNFSIYESGIKYILTGDTLAISNIEGVHVLYYNKNVLTDAVNPSTDLLITIIKNHTLVSIIYWDVSASVAIYIGEERHGVQMDGATHAYLHFTNGMAYRTGLALSNILSDGAGATADAQFGVESGGVSDEDIYHEVAAVNSTDGLPIFYMLGSNGDWQKHLETGFSLRTFDGTSATRLAYNQYTGGAWQLSQVTDHDFMLCHIFATSEKDNPIIAVMGQAIYTTRRAARAGAKTEIHSLILNDLMFPEIRPIASVIFQTRLSYASTINARIVTTAEGDDYIDWRDQAISRVSISTSNHGSLSGLVWDSSGHSGNAGTIAGFDSSGNAEDKLPGALGTAFELTISGGIVAKNGDHVNLLIDTESNTASDDLDNITGYIEGDMIVISPADGARTIVVKNNSNLNLQGVDFTMDNIYDSLVLLNLGGDKWKELSRASN